MPVLNANIRAFNFPKLYKFTQSVFCSSFLRDGAASWTKEGWKEEERVPSSEPAE